MPAVAAPLYFWRWDRPSGRHGAVYSLPMNRFRSTILLSIAAVALVLFVTTIVLWIHSRGNTDHTGFSTSQRSFYLESSSQNGLLLRVTDLSPTVGARVTGMTATPNGWTVTPGQPVKMQVSNLSADTNISPKGAATENQGSPLSISRMKLQFHGFVWSSGFTTEHAVLPGPFPARQLDTFTVTYTSAAVTSILVMLIAGYFGRRARAAAAEGRCPKCGHDISAATDQCPECGTPLKATV